MNKNIIITDNKNIRSREYKQLYSEIDPLFMDHTEFSVNKIIKQDPSIIIIDIDSFKELKEITLLLKQDFSTAYVPVISFFNRNDITADMLELIGGVDDYLLRPVAFKELRLRMEMAIKRSRHSFFANPLTGLPGGIVIEKALEKKLDKKEPFVTGHVDIDNFKCFNDRYGYLKGDRVIMQTAYMLNVALKTWGSRGDFLGHIGGDDFVVITTPEKFNEICSNFICMFDTITPFHYSQEDRKNGFIKMRDRMKILREIPLMSVTVALVVKNSKYELNSLIEINDRIAEVKQYLKKIPGSKYMADRRMLKKDDSLSLQIFNNDDKTFEKYKPLGQLLVEKNILTLEDLDKALKEHWRRGILLGEVLKELDMISDEELNTALKAQVNELKTG